MKNQYDYLNDVKMDFSCYEEENIFEKEINFMGEKINKRTARSHKKIFAVAACVTILTVTTAFASGLAGNIIKTITTGYNSYVQTDHNAPQPIMDELKGKIFDKNGVALEFIAPSDFDNIYDKDGNKITGEIYAQMIAEATGGLVTISADYNPEESEITFETLEKAQENAAFDIKIPEYLPEDYKLSRIYTFKDETGAASGDYVNIEYKNSQGSNIIIFERNLNENTAFEAGTDGTLEEITINGNTAVIMDGKNLDFETKDSVSVGISAYDGIPRNELIKIAESMR